MATTKCTLKFVGSYKLLFQDSITSLMYISQGTSRNMYSKTNNKSAQIIKFPHCIIRTVFVLTALFKLGIFYTYFSKSNISTYK